MKGTTKTLFAISTAVIWAVTIAIGLNVLLTYSNTPGEIATAPTKWPVASRIELASDRPTLIMLAHPRCPCTRASIQELARLMGQVENRVKAFVIFIKPDDVSGDWEKTDLWLSASAIPGVIVLSDEGNEAIRFRTKTSGQTLLYGADGGLLFKGGITDSRGHEGDNEGRNAITALINSGPFGSEETPVFGCPLFSRTQGSEVKEAIDENDKKRRPL